MKRLGASASHTNDCVKGPKKDNNLTPFTFLAAGFFMKIIAVL